MFNGDIISMPDKWEYPWYAAWDLAFHTIALSLVDFDFAKEQLLLMLRSLYSSSQRADTRIRMELQRCESTRSCLGHALSSTRWSGPWALRHQFPGTIVQRFDAQFQLVGEPQRSAGRNVFAGGFLGLDNIGVFDRSAPLPTGGSLEQADGTAWMAFYCQNMLEIALDSERIRPDVRGSRFQVRSSTFCGLPMPWTGLASIKMRCGTRRMGSSMTCCGCRTDRRCV